ncbi:MAG: LysR substrate-binding domain-containing protein [Proteobacteria bacterium]|nr:LysR substrate-binding domain-containing protein [Pseudomonadota bacterium]
MPTITQLKYVLAVHKTGHFGRAAAEMAVSQPTLSGQIQKVEAELGLTLFDRQSKPIKLTEHGHQLVELAGAVIAAHQKLIAAAAGGFTEPAGPFSIGIIPTLAPYVLPWFLREFAQRYPAVELSIAERSTNELLIEISTNRIDTAILATPLGEPSITERILFYDPFYIYAHAEESLLKKDAVAVSDIDSRRLWLLEDGHCFRAQVINLCGVQQRALLGSVEFAAGSFETLRHLIDASGGYTLFPETYARTLPRGVRQQLIRPFELRTPTREVSLIHHRRNWKTQLIDLLASLITRNLPRSFSSELDQQEVLAIEVQGGRAAGVSSGS